MIRKKLCFLVSFINEISNALKFLRRSQLHFVQSKNINSPGKPTQGKAQVSLSQSQIYFFRYPISFHLDASNIEIET